MLSLLQQSRNRQSQDWGAGGTSRWEYKVTGSSEHLLSNSKHKPTHPKGSTKPRAWACLQISLPPTPRPGASMCVCEFWAAYWLMGLPSLVQGQFCPHFSEPEETSMRRPGKPGFLRVQKLHQLTFKHLQGLLQQL